MPLTDEESTDLLVKFDNAMTLAVNAERERCAQRCRERLDEFSRLLALPDAGGFNVHELLIRQAEAKCCIEAIERAEG